MNWKNLQKLASINEQENSDPCRILYDFPIIFFLWISQDDSQSHMCIPQWNLQSPESDKQLFHLVGTC